MTTLKPLPHLLEKALAFAHAAVDDESGDRVGEARRFATEALGYVERIKPASFTLAEARHVFELASHLRTMLALLERRTLLRELPGSN